jgi:ribosomal protein L17
VGGRFAKGNVGGPGNPHAAKVGQLRSALLDAVTTEDIRAVLDALVTEAKAGSVPAMREFFNRVLGQAQAVDAIERLAEVEAVLDRYESTVLGSPQR